MNITWKKKLIVTFFRVEQSAKSLKRLNSSTAFSHISFQTIKQIKQMIISYVCCDLTLQQMEWTNNIQSFQEFLMIHSCDIKC